VRALGGNLRLERVIVERTSSGERRTLTAGAMVVLIGAKPRTEWLAAEIELDDDGAIRTGPQLRGGVLRRGAWQNVGREPFLVETSRPGVFAVGDVRSGATKMVAHAAGDGGMAVRFAAEHLVRTAAR
jgi:thioredoxin reductase (NADPH)